MPKSLKYISKLALLLILTLLIFSCRTTKYVSDEQYLLSKVTIDKDLKSISNDEILSYMRQHPNSSIFGLWKLQLGIYNLSGTDTTKRVNRWLRKIGDEPIIYDDNLTEITKNQLQKHFSNSGYMDAEITSELVYPKKKKRVNLIYRIKSNEPYLIGDYKVDVEERRLARLANDSARSLIQPENIFNSYTLDDERARITAIYRNMGSFNFTKNELIYLADSTDNKHRIDLKLQLRDENLPDSLKNDKLFNRYRIQNVYYKTEGLTLSEPLNDTLSIANYHFTYGNKRNIRPSVLTYNTHLLPGRLYSDRAVERTYSSMNALSAVKYMDIAFQEVNDTLLNAHITVTPSKLMSISTDVESTYSAGYWGLGGNINYGHRNLFRGSESLTLGGRAAYEYQGKNQHAFELGGDASLKFPTFLLPFMSRERKRNIPATTEITGTYSFRKRPREYTGIVTGMGYRYSWSERTQIKHNVDVLNVSYVYYPFISDEYYDYLSTSPYFVYNFQNHLIVSSGYKGSYSTFRQNQPFRDHITMKYAVELAGNSLYALNNMLNSPKDENGSYKLFGIRYAQYAKADFDITRYQNFDQDNRIVYHAGVGVTVPYGNNPLVPFEKRYFSGGANSVRGWTAYQLGPGVYRSDRKMIDYNTQMGDIKIDLNMEIRSKLFWRLESALFLDAGNVWTIRDYEDQPGGAFDFKSFISEMGLAYGAGIRADFSFFVFRVDLGARLYDPSLSRTERWRTGLKRKDMALNLAIGYPF